MTITPSTKKEIISTTLGIGSFAGLSLMSLPLVLSGVGAVGIYVGSKLLLSDPKRKFVLPQKVEGDVTECQVVLDNIKKMRKQVKDNQIKGKLKWVIDLGDKIVKVLIDRKESMRKVSELLKILKSVEDILKKYLELSQHKVDYKRMKKTFNNFNSLLDEIVKALNNYYKKGLKGEVMDLDVEMKLLKNILNTSGSIEQ